MNIYETIRSEIKEILDKAGITDYEIDAETATVLIPPKQQLPLNELADILNPEVEKIRRAFDGAWDFAAKVGIVGVEKGKPKILITFTKLRYLASGGDDLDGLAEQIELLNMTEQQAAGQVKPFYLKKLQSLGKYGGKHDALFRLFCRRFKKEPWIGDFILDYLKTIKNSDPEEIYSPLGNLMECFFRSTEEQWDIPFTDAQKKEAARIIIKAFGMDPDKAVSYPDRFAPEGHECHNDRYFNWAKYILTH